MLGNWEKLGIAALIFIIGFLTIGLGWAVVIIIFLINICLFRMAFSNGVNFWFFEEEMSDNREIITRKELEKKTYKAVGILALILIFGFLMILGDESVIGLLIIVLCGPFAMTMLPYPNKYKIVENDGITPIPDSFIENEKVRITQKGIFRYTLEWVIGILFVILVFWILFL